MSNKRKMVFPLVLGAIAALLALPAVAGATHSNGDGAKHDFVVGSSKQLVDTPLGTFPAHLHINAKTENGVNTQGQWWTAIDGSSVGLGTVTISGHTVCLFVNGNYANDRGRIDESSTPLAPVGFGVLGVHKDNGEPGSTTANATPPDVAGGFLTGPPPATCPTFTLTGHTVDQGNYVVHDG